jgi:ERCC4-related helicase/ERCC4-type nuclease
MVRWIQHPLIQPGKIEARLYQQVLAADVLKTGNTMIVAPTALGKTIVAALVAAERLKKYPKSKVLVLAPSKPLVVQHEESFRQFLKATITSLTGAIKPDERIHLWEKSQVICATPQTVESDIIAGRYSLKEVSLLVFDECHRGVGGYAYVFLAGRYTADAQDPLILGLTASPGWDENKINGVCENLFIQEVKIKKESDPDVTPYFNPVKVKWVKVELGKDLSTIRDHLDAALKSRLKTLKKLGIIPSITRVSKKDVLQAKAKAQARIGSSTHPPKKCYLAVSLLTAVINVLHSLELLETQGTGTLYHYFQRLKKKKTKAAKSLINDDEFRLAMHLTRKAYLKGVEHPKLKKLIRILKKELREDSRVIVFSQFRDTVEDIYQRCQDEEISAVKFFGQASREREKGLSQKKQKDIIKAFRMGTYQVLISTSVAEEGIDIPSVDLVILYEPVPSEIRMIQRRGRTGRKSQGCMYILITKGTRDESYYYSSKHKEEMMKEQLSKGYKTSVDRIIVDENNLKPYQNHSDVLKPDHADVKLYQNNKSDLKAEDLEINIQNEANVMKLGGGEFNSSEEGKKQPLIYADSREGSSGVLRELSLFGAEIKTMNLSVADYQVSNEVAIERKSSKDFVGSIMDKRLHKQAKELVQSFQKPVIILEGEDLYSSSLNPNAVRGALASLAVDFGIPIIPTRSPEDTASMIMRIAIREQSQGRPGIHVRTDKKPLTLEEQQLYIVESLPKVGPVTAHKLMETFGSVKNVFNASADELKKVEGIGDKIAQNIREVIDSGFIDDFRVISPPNKDKKKLKEYRLIKGEVAKK